MTSRALRTGSFGTLLPYFDELRSREFRFHVWLAVFQEHGDDLAKIRIQFIEYLRLRVRARKTRNESDKKTVSRGTLNYGGVLCIDVPRLPRSIGRASPPYKFTHTLFVCVYFSSASRP